MVANSLNLWGGWYMWSDCHLLRQPSAGIKAWVTAFTSSWPVVAPWQWSPVLTGLWWLSHQCTLWGLVVGCFLEWEDWLWLHFARWPFSTVLSLVFRQEWLIETPETVWVPVPVLGCLSSAEVWVWYTIADPLARFCVFVWINCIYT